MRPLAIELAFDAVSDARLRRVWSSLATTYGGPTTAELGIAPHLTLALFRRDEPIGDLAHVLTALAKRCGPFSMELTTVDGFATSEGVVFLRPALATELTRVHGLLHDLLGADAARVDAYYRPDAWQPHCTMALEVPVERAAAVRTACRAPDATGPVTITRVQLVRYRPATAVGTWALHARVGAGA